MEAGPTTEELKRWDAEHVWHGFTQMEEYQPLIIQKAVGCVLTDIDGREYLDGVSSLWCNLHGHNHPRLNAAVRRQLDCVAHVTSLGMSSEVTVRFARRLVQFLPAGLRHVFFSDSGSTAVEVAVKMALQYWQQCPDARPAKTRYAAFDLAYHGDTIGGVSLGGIARFHDVFRPLLFQPIRLPLPDGRHPPKGVSREAACAYYLAGIEAILKVHHEELAAVIIEPLVQAAGGMIHHPPGFLRGLRALTRAYDVLLIADEVAVGMGRTGRFLACEHEEVIPDLVCLAKGISGGYLPLAVTVSSNAIWEAFRGSFSQSRTFFHGHTFGGNALAAAVGLENLALFEDEKTLEKMVPAVHRMRHHLDRMQDLPLVGDTRQQGLIGAVELVRNKQTCEVPSWEERFGQRVCNYAMGQGVWLRPLGNVLVLMPPLNVTIAELDCICDAAFDGIVALAKQLGSGASQDA